MFNPLNALLLWNESIFGPHEVELNYEISPVSKLSNTLFSQLAPRIVHGVRGP